MSQWLMLDFTCPEHGVFESMIDKREGRPIEAPCPVLMAFASPPPDTHSGRAIDNVTTGGGYAEACALPSPVVTAYAVVGRMKLGEASQGKNYESERPAHIMDTRALGEGQPIEEWKAENKIKDRDRRHAENKEFLR